MTNEDDVCSGMSTRLKSLNATDESEMRYKLPEQNEKYCEKNNVKLIRWTEN